MYIFFFFDISIRIVESAHGVRFEKRQNVFHKPQTIELWMLLEDCGRQHGQSWFGVIFETIRRDVHSSRALKTLTEQRGQE